MMNERPVIAGSKALFVTCFVALMATSFAFLIRAFTIGDWAADFGLDPVQQGELSGAGIWPFAISIILFSLVIDKIGYGKAMAFAFVCHVASVGVTLWAPYMLVDSASADADAVAAGQRAGYWVLYAGMFLAGIAAGTVEAVINPVIATVYAQNKTKWLSILHAAWPGGFVLAGLVAMAMKPTGLLGEMVEGGMGWQWKVGLLLVPTLIYGAMLLRCRFPVNERVTAGVSYREMLSEVGGLGAFFAAGLVFWEIERVVSHFYELPTLPEVAGLPIPLALIPSAVVGLVFLLYTFSLGRPLFLFLLGLMVLLATTELGTDGWIKELMEPAMNASFGLDGGWVLIYSASIMVVLRLFAGRVVKVLNPVGVLLVSSLFAAGGLMFLSTATGIAILAAATVYAVGQTFFWPTTLGLVAERFPKGGALTLNTIAGVGMLGVGIVGMPLLGTIQSIHIEKALAHEVPAQYEQVLGKPAFSIAGAYRPIDQEKLEALDSDRLRDRIAVVQSQSKQAALFSVAILPAIMFVCYLVLWIWFRMHGGYRAQELPVTVDEPKKDFRPI